TGAGHRLPEDASGSMTIKFICSCGKHLRARDEMAARRSRCPRCGAPVGIPSLKPNHVGSEAKPLSPAERLGRRPVVPPRNPRQADLAPPPTEKPTPANHVRVAAPVPETAPVPIPRPEADAAMVRLIKASAQPPRRRGAWQLETRWYHCLVYPLRAW